MVTLPDAIISPQWVMEQTPGKVKVVDASWHMPATKRDAKAEFTHEHLPHAQFFDLDANSDNASSLPHMLPSAEFFSNAISRLGIHNSDAIVVYDTQGLFSSARLWWMFRVYGHSNVAVLDGGVPAWKNAGFPTESGRAAPVSPARFNVALQPHLVCNKKDVKDAIHNASALVLDARSPARFTGAEPDPRPHIRTGHIPTSQNVHYARCLKDNGQMKTIAELNRVLSQAGVNTQQRVISSCGSGVTACILDLALTLTGHENHAVYDGSWAEWGSDTDCPIEQG